MPSKEQAHSNEKAVSKQRAPRSATPELTPLEQKMLPELCIQRARLDFSSLTWGDMLQLQRTVGNRTVGRLLSGTRQTAGAVLQRVPYRHHFWTRQASDRVAVDFPPAQFYLVSRPGAHVPPGLVDKFHTAMTTAQTNLQHAINLLAQPVAGRELLALRWCFRPPGNNTQPTRATVTRKLQQILAGLQTPDLQIVDVNAGSLAEGAHGYVKRHITRGRIHTRFDLDLHDTAFSLIHEASHKFAGTDDNGGYVGEGVQTYVAVAEAYQALGMSANLQIRIASNDVGLNNADSYAGFAMYVGAPE